MNVLLFLLMLVFGFLAVPMAWVAMDTAAKMPGILDSKETQKRKTQENVRQGKIIGGIAAVFALIAFGCGWLLFK